MGKCGARRKAKTAVAKLARTRRRLSKVTLASRVQELTSSEFSQYCATTSRATAYRDRGKAPKKAKVENPLKKKVLEQWSKLIAELAHKATIAKLLVLLKKRRIAVSRKTAVQWCSSLETPRSPRVYESVSNDPCVNASQPRRS